MKSSTVLKKIGYLLIVIIGLGIYNGIVMWPECTTGFPCGTGFQFRWLHKTLINLGILIGVFLFVWAFFVRLPKKLGIKNTLLISASGLALFCWGALIFGELSEKAKEMFLVNGVIWSSVAIFILFVALRQQRKNK